MGLYLFLQIFIIFCIFVIGSLFGSFLTLATYRIPRHEDIIKTRSYCPTCKHKLNFFDLIPVISYLMRGGKCKYCKEKISIRYFLFEVTNGLVFVGFYFIFGYTIQMAIVSLVYVFIFLMVGSYIMKMKMTQEEKDSMKEKIKKENKNTSKKVLSKKSGVFISELVVALLLFITVMVTVFILLRNSNMNLRNTSFRANANFYAVQNLEYCLAMDYDKLASYTLDLKKDGITYQIQANVTKMSDQDFSKEDIVKKIEVTVSYHVNGEEKQLVMSTLKGKV